MNRRKFLKFFGFGAAATVVPVELVASAKPSNRLLILTPRSVSVLSHAAISDNYKPLPADQFSPDEIKRMRKLAVKQGLKPLKFNFIK